MPATDAPRNLTPHTPTRAALRCAAWRPDQRLIYIGGRPPSSRTTDWKSGDSRISRPATSRSRSTHAGGLQQLSDKALGRRAAIPVGRRRRVGVHGEQHEPANGAETHLVAEFPAHAELLEHPQHGAHPEVVRDAPSTRWLNGRSRLFCKACISRQRCTERPASRVLPFTLTASRTQAGY